jgi:hypothetical protein
MPEVSIPHVKIQELFRETFWETSKIKNNIFREFSTSSRILFRMEKTALVSSFRFEVIPVFLTHRLFRNG